MLLLRFGCSYRSVWTPASSGICMVLEMFILKGTAAEIGIEVAFVHTINEFRIVEEM